MLIFCCVNYEVGSYFDFMVLFSIHTLFIKDLFESHVKMKTVFQH